MIVGGNGRVCSGSKVAQLPLHKVIFVCLVWEMECHNRFPSHGFLQVEERARAPARQESQSMGDRYRSYGGDSRYSSGSSYRGGRDNYRDYGGGGGGGGRGFGRGGGYRGMYAVFAHPTKCSCLCWTSHCNKSVNFLTCEKKKKKKKSL